MITVRFITGESFCSHCRNAIKILKDIYPELESKNVKLVQYDVRVRRPEAVRELKEKYGIKWDVEPVTADFIKELKKKYKSIYVPLLEVNGRKVPFQYDSERLLRTILEHKAE